MFKKKVKLYAVNPLLIGLLVLGLNANSATVDELKLSNNSLELVSQEKTEEETQEEVQEESKDEVQKETEQNESKDDYAYLKDLHLEMKTSKEDIKNLFEEEKELEFDVELKDDEIIFNKHKELEKESSEKSSENTEEKQKDAKQEKEETQLGYAKLSHEEEKLMLDLALELEENNLLEKLNKREFNYFEVKEEAEKIVLKLVPDEGLDSDKLDDSQVFIKLEKNKVSVIKGEELKSEKTEKSSVETTSQDKQVNNNNNLNNDNNEKVNTPVENNSNQNVESPTTTPAPTTVPTTTEAPTTAPTEEEYVDYQTAGARTNGSNAYHFPDEASAIAWAESKEQEWANEIEKFNNLPTIEEQEAYVYTDFMHVNGYTGWGGGGFSYGTASNPQRGFSIWFY